MKEYRIVNLTYPGILKPGDMVQVLHKIPSPFTPFKKEPLDSPIEKIVTKIKEDYKAFRSFAYFDDGFAVICEYIFRTFPQKLNSLPNFMTEKVTASEIQTMNHRVLLQKYIHHIISHEGIDYIDDEYKVQFTKKEIAELKRLSDTPIAKD